MNQSNNFSTRKKYYIFKTLYFFLFIIFLVSCTTSYKMDSGEAKYPENLLAEDGLTVASDKSQHIIPVFYGTDRKGVGPNENRIYSGERGGFEYGIAHVSIPEGHNPGNLERPFRFLFIKFSENADDHVIIIQKPHKLKKELFFETLKYDVSSDSEDGVFVFIHGFNVSFEDAILRTGQLAHDLSFKGPAVSYSWPSQSRVPDYLTDGVLVELTKRHLKQFLADIREKSGSKRICVLAHSMGNRAFTEVLIELAKENEAGGILFDQVVLAAPDIDAEIFQTLIAPEIKGTANQITLYTSSNDNVLELSSKLRTNRVRAGQASDNVIVFDGIKTIDASSTNDGFFSFLKLGHSYYGGTLIKDMHYVIKHGLKPNDRYLKEVKNPSGAKYWEFSN